VATELLSPFRGLWLELWGEPFTVEEESYGQTVRVAIVEGIQRRGDALAHNLAAISYGPLLLDNFNAREQPRARCAKRPR
jgi:hypothetical protein